MGQLSLKYGYPFINIDPIEVRDAGHLSSHERELLKFAQLDNVADTEAWTVKGTNKELSYSTHGIFRYYGKFPPPIATHLINQYTNERDLVCDPTCGSGTTGVESLRLNRRCFLSDVNPLSLLLAKVKTTQINLFKLQKATQRVVEAYRPLTCSEYDFKPVGLRNPDHWFLADTSNSLRGLHFQIIRERDPDIRDFLFVVFAATVRKVSRATTQQGRLFLDVNTAEQDALESFKKKSIIAINAIHELPDSSGMIEIVKHDLRTPYPHSSKFHLLIVHPPYFNAYKYSGINSLELSWLGHVHGEIRKNEIREYFKVGKPENVQGYVHDMVNSLNNISKALVPGGRLSLMIGDTIIRNEYIPVIHMILEEMKCSNLRVEIVALRVPKYTEATWVASQRRRSEQIGIKLYDYVIVFRRN